jgi:hypothetical protein
MDDLGQYNATSHSKDDYLRKFSENSYRRQIIPAQQLSPKKKSPQ